MNNKFDYLTKAACNLSQQSDPLLFNPDLNPNTLNHLTPYTLNPKPNCADGLRRSGRARTATWLGEPDSSPEGDVWPMRRSARTRRQTSYYSEDEKDGGVGPQARTRSAARDGEHQTLT